MKSTARVIETIFGFILVVILTACGGGGGSSSGGGTSPGGNNSGSSIDVTGTWVLSGSNRSLTLTQSGTTISGTDSGSCGACSIKGYSIDSSVFLTDVDNTCFAPGTVVPSPRSSFLSGTVSGSSMTLNGQSPLGNCLVQNNFSGTFIKQSNIDITPPSIPTGISAVAGTSGGTNWINLTWSPSSDNVKVAGYKIYRDGSYLRSLIGATSTGDSGLSPLTQYCYTVSAYDTAGNESGQSGSVCATTLLSIDTTPPTIPSNLSAVVTSSSQINLSWWASADNFGVVGYKIYRNGTYLNTSTTTSDSDTGLAPSTQYCYAISAYDAAGNESAKSSSVCTTTIAAPPVGTTDITPPSTPTNLWVVTGGNIQIGWTASNDNVGVAGYKIYKDGAYFKSVTTTSAYDTDSTSIKHCYTVSAYDAAGNESTPTSYSVCSAVIY